MKSNKKSLNIFVVNCGSSSLKYRIIRMPDGVELVRGEAERVGVKSLDRSVITHTVGGTPRSVKTPLADHAAALKKALELLAEDTAADPEVRFDVFAHRYVHPGTVFNKTMKVTSGVLRRLQETLPLAMIHNPIIYNLIEFCHSEYSGVEQFVVFDTSFHKTIPPEFATYALPLHIMKKYHIRRIGFHGISHRYVMEEACRFLGRSRNSQRIISCHLGSGGSSVCAIRNGKSINSSMGFTPLEGLMMNTRCGDIDPSTIFYLMFKERFSPKATERILNNKSGILGVFHASSDLRDVARDIAQDRRAKLAFTMYVRRVRMYIAFYALILKKADILLFTDSLGTELPLLRQQACADMGFLGIDIDTRKNEAYQNGVCDISAAGSATKVLIVPTNEEIMIAREAYKEWGAHDTGR